MLFSFEENGPDFLDLFANFINICILLSDIDQIGPTKAVNTRVITGSAAILSKGTLVFKDAAFGNFRRLWCCFTHCILLFVTKENNFVLFYFHTK